MSSEKVPVLGRGTSQKTLALTTELDALPIWAKGFSCRGLGQRGRGGEAGLHPPLPLENPQTMLRGCRAVG